MSRGACRPVPVPLIPEHTPPVREDTDQSPLNRLVSGLYDALLDNAAWPRTLASMTRVTESAGVYFHVTDTQRSRVLTVQAHGVDEQAQREYERDMLPVCPRMAHFRKTRAPILYDALHTSDDGMRHDPFYAWLAQYDLKYYLGAQVCLRDHIMASLSIQRSPRQGQATPDLIRLIEQLHPHLCHVVRSRILLDQVDLRAQAAEGALDLLRVGTVFVDRRARVLHASTPARAMLDAKDGLTVLAGQLHATHAEDDRALLAAMATAGTAAADGGGAALAVRRRSLGRPYQVIVCPVPPAVSIFAVLRPAAIIFITDPDRLPQNAATLLARMHGLTPAEGAMAADLVAGYSPAEHAERRGVTGETARTRLKRIQAKTGTNSQLALMRVLMSGLAGAAAAGAIAPHP